MSVAARADQSRTSAGLSEGAWLFAKVREAGTHTLIYGLGSALQSVLGFLLIPLYTRFFSTEAFGILALIQLGATLAGVFFYLGASSALGRSYYDYDNEQDRRVVISTAFWITIGGATTQVLLGWLLRRPLAALLLGDATYGPHVAVALAASALTFMNGLFYLVLRYERKSLQVVVLNLAALLMTVALVWYLLAVPKLGVMAPLLGSCVAQAAVGAALFLMSRRQIVFQVSRLELRLQMGFGLAAVSSGLLYYVLDTVDRLLINHYSTLSDVGVYSLGYKIGMAIGPLLVVPFSQIWAPMRMEYRTHAGTPGLLSHVLTYFLMVGLFLTAVVSVFARDIVQVMAGRAEYFMAYRVVPFVMLGTLFYGLVNILDYGLWIERKVHYYLGVFAAALLLNVGLNVVLLPRFGYLAAAVTTLISYMFVAGAVFAISNRLYPVRVEPRLLLVLGSAVVVVLVGQWSGDGLLAVLTRGGLLLGLLAYWYQGLLRPRERARLLGVLRSRAAGRRSNA